jgi:hypothetical protein
VETEGELPDVVQVEPLSLEEVDTILAPVHEAPVRVSLCMEQAVNFFAVDAAPALEAFVFETPVRG